MIASHNHLFVSVESEYNDQIELKSGHTLYMYTGTGFETEDTNSKHTYTQNQRRRHYGTVEAVPLRLTEEMKVRYEDPGIPEPGRYLTHEQVEEVKRRNKNTLVNSTYSVNIWEPEWKTCADFNMEVQVGDKIYFHYLTAQNDNVIIHNDRKLYKLPYQQAICVVRRAPSTHIAVNIDFCEQQAEGLVCRDIKGVQPLGYLFPDLTGFDRIVLPKNEGPYWVKIIPLAGHVLIEPAWEDGVEDLGDGKRGKISSSGLVTELHDKPKYLEGIVRHIPTPMHGECVEVVPGDRIIYEKNSDWEVEIEGKKYYVMRYWDIMGKLEHTDSPDDSWKGLGPLGPFKGPERYIQLTKTDDTK